MDQCLIYGYIVDSNGTPREGVLVTAFPASIPAVISGTEYAIYPREVEALTTSTGYFELDLIQNVDFYVHITAIGFREKIRIPASASASLWPLSAAYTTGDRTPTEDNW
jgi:hypothetical protein